MCSDCSNEIPNTANITMTTPEPSSKLTHRQVTLLLFLVTDAFAKQPNDSDLLELLQKLKLQLDETAPKPSALVDAFWQKLAENNKKTSS